MTQNTPRRRMSSKRRHHIFSEHCTAHNVAPCCVCGDPIHRHKDRWIVEHIRALALLGDDLNTNCAPAHESCRRIKDKRDIALITKAKRQAQACLPRHGDGKRKPASRWPAGHQQTSKFV